MLLAISAHLVAAVIWVGGMFFAYVCLRPSLPGLLEPPLPGLLWRAVLSRFFLWVWAAILVLFASGLYMAFHRYGGFGAWPGWLMTMFILGIAMMVLFSYVYFFPFDHLIRALDASNPALVADSIHQIRRMVAINLSLGLIVIIAASGARYL